MANPLFQQFGQKQQNSLFNNPLQMIQQFNQFKSTFQGDPQQKVQEMLRNGQMTQDQFNQLSSMAQVFKQLIGR